ncbi:hypothetical protein LINGRAHAP2_LOCUS34770 [Linum grandiflorum]
MISDPPIIILDEATPCICCSFVLLVINFQRKEEA